MCNPSRDAGGTQTLAIDAGSKSMRVLRKRHKLKVELPLDVIFINPSASSQPLADLFLTLSLWQICLSHSNRGLKPHICTAEEQSAIQYARDIRTVTDVLSTARRCSADCISIGLQGPGLMA